MRNAECLAVVQETSCMEDVVGKPVDDGALFTIQHSAFSNDKTVLIVVHDYPPIVSAGAERIVKFAQYLPAYGFQPLILTTGRYGERLTDAASQVYRAADLVHALFSGLRRRRAAGVAQEAQFRVATVGSQSLLGRVRDEFMVPDTKLGWLLPAVRLGNRLIAQQRPALIFSTSPPETAHLVARQLARRYRLPWVADLRDGWLFEPPNPAVRQAAWRRSLEQRLEARVIVAAQAVIAATNPIAEDLRLRYAAAAGRIHVITNGFDAAEFAGLQRQRPKDGVFRLVYTGALASSRQGTSAAAFFAGLAQFVHARPATPLQVIVIGDVSPVEQAAAASHGLTDVVSFRPAVSRREAHQAQLDADGLLLITAPGQRSVATLKLFDYIGAGVPILALAADNAAAAIVQQYNLGVTVAPDDPAAISYSLHELVARHQLSDTRTGFTAAQQQFERRQLTGQLAALFRSVLNQA